MPLPLDEFFRRITGQPMALPGAVAPTGPVTAPTPTAAAVAAPTLQETQQQDFNNAALSRMGQLGMMLVAAGQRMTPRERATILAQAPQYMDGIQNDMQQAAQARLMNTRAQQEQSDVERRNALFDRMKSEPGFAEKFGVTPEALATLSPSSLEQIVVHRATQDPLDRAAKIAAIAASSKPKFEKIGTDALGQDQFGWIYPNEKIVPYTQGGGGSSAGGVPSLSAVAGQLDGKTPQERLDIIKKNYPALASEVEGIAMGRMPFPTRKFGTKQGDALSTLVSWIDPSYTPMTYDERKKTELDYSPGGTVGKQILFANTGIKHGGELLGLADKLPNHTNWGMLNKTINELDAARSVNSAQGGPVNSYKQAAINFMDEIGKALGAGASGEREELKRQIEAANGPEAIKDVIRTQITLLKDKIETQQGEYKKTMGPMAGNPNFVSGEAQAWLDKIFAKENAAPAGGASTLDKAKRILGQ